MYIQWRYYYDKSNAVIASLIRLKKHIKYAKFIYQEANYSTLVAISQHDPLKIVAFALTVGSVLIQNYLFC